MPWEISKMHRQNTVRLNGEDRHLACLLDHPLMGQHSGREKDLTLRELSGYVRI